MLTLRQMLKQLTRDGLEFFNGSRAKQKSSRRPGVSESDKCDRHGATAAARGDLGNNAKTHAIRRHPANALKGSEMHARLQPVARAGRVVIDMLLKRTCKADLVLAEELRKGDPPFPSHGVSA